MHTFVSFNRSITKPANTTFPGNSNAVLYGKGVFTTLSVNNSKLFLWDQHWTRLSENAASLDIDISELSKSLVEDSAYELIEGNTAVNARIRITLFDTSSGSLWQNENELKTSVLIQTADARNVQNPFQLTVSPYRINSTSPLANIKSCNYLENILALDLARESGFDEALRLNELGEVSSACMANIFWIKSGALFSPKIETGCLSGITRSLVIDLASEIGLEFMECRASLSDVLTAEEVFLTSSGLMIAATERIDNVEFRSQISEKLKDKLDQIKDKSCRTA